MKHKNYNNNNELAEKEGFTPLFSTLAVLDEQRKTSDAKVTIPPVSSIEDAKEWVESNEK